MKAVILQGVRERGCGRYRGKNSPEAIERIVSDQSTLQLAALRLLPGFFWSDMYVPTGQQYVEMVQDQLKELPAHHVIGEPQMRDVGSCSRAYDGDTSP